MSNAIDKPQHQTQDVNKHLRISKPFSAAHPKHIHEHIFAVTHTPWQCGVQVPTSHPPLLGGHGRWDGHGAVGAARRGGGAHRGQLLAVPNPLDHCSHPTSHSCKQTDAFYAAFQAGAFFQKFPGYFLIRPMIVSGKFWHC